MKYISVLTPCYNEEDNVEELHNQVRAEFEKLGVYSFEHVFIDNASTDQTVSRIVGMASKHANVRLIMNSRNFGHIRSPFHGLLCGTQGDAVILLAADFQDPPSLIPKLIDEWERGYKIVKAVKTNSDETAAMFYIRKLFYAFINRLSDIELTKNHTGSGLYDRNIIDILRKIDEPYPYLRGLLSEIGFEAAIVPFHQPARKRGITSNNFYTLYDLAVSGITQHSKVPLRIMTIGGFCLSILSLFLCAVFFVLKIIFWEKFQLGLTPLILGLFFFSSAQLFSLGVLGEYIGGIFTHVKKRPLVIEKGRVNF